MLGEKSNIISSKRRTKSGEPRSLTFDSVVSRRARQERAPFLRSRGRVTLENCEKIIITGFFYPNYYSYIYLITN